MGESLKGKRIAFLATDGVEQVELTRPWAAIEDAGGEVELLSLAPGDVQGMNHLDKGDVFSAARAVSDANVEDYDGLVLPGGAVNPDSLRMNEAAVGFVRRFVAADKPVAAICHAPWTLVEADAVRGRTLTSWPSVQTDIRNAGGTWVDQEVCVDGRLVTSRKPDDLEAFCASTVAVLEKA